MRFLPDASKHLKTSSVILEASMKQAVTILGSGAWGCALAEVLAHRGHDVLMWCRESAIATEIATLHTNSTFLHGLTFHEKIKLSGVVLTKLDGDARGGAALSIKSRIGVPIKFMGLGEKIKDFEIFHPDRIASRILDLGDLQSLIEKADLKTRWVMMLKKVCFFQY